MAIYIYVAYVKSARAALSVFIYVGKICARYVEGHPCAYMENKEIRVERVRVPHFVFMIKSVQSVNCARGAQFAPMTKQRLHAKNVIHPHIVLTNESNIHVVFVIQPYYVFIND